MRGGRRDLLTVVAVEDDFEVRLEPLLHVICIEDCYLRGLLQLRAHHANVSPRDRQDRSRAPRCSRAAAERVLDRHALDVNNHVAWQMWSQMLFPLKALT
jgi:hypothetical protein